MTKFLNVVLISGMKIFHDMREMINSNIRKQHALFKYLCRNGKFSACNATSNQRIILDFKTNI